MRLGRGIEIDRRDSVDWLADWHVLEGRCGACGHGSKLYWSRIKDKIAPTSRLGDLESRFRCKACGNRTGNRISIMKLPRD